MDVRRWLAGRARRRSGAFATVIVAVASVMPIVSATSSAAAPAALPAATAAPSGATMFGFIPTTPTRVFDTRPGEPARVNRGGALGGKETMTVDVASTLGVPLTDVGGVALNITIDQPSAAGFVTVWPTGALPVASTVNFATGQTVPNGTIVGIAPDGTVQVFNGSVAPVHVIVDVNGWVPVGAGFTPITPVRALETRAGEPGHGAQGALGVDGVVSVNVTGLLPEADRARASAVTVNVTAVNPTAESYLTAYPAGASRPPTSSLNVRRSDIVANSAVLGVGSGGNIEIYNHVGTIDVVVDVTGYFVDGKTFRGLAPKRLLDTRESASPLGARRSGVVKIDLTAGLPRGFVGAVAVNVTAATTTASGFLTVWPASSPQPTASSVNFTAGRVSANTVIVGVDADSTIAVYNSAGTTNIIVDITGWFAQDTLGLLADGRDMRRYSLGDDSIGVVVCQDPAGALPKTDAAAALAKLGEAGAFYRWLSGDRYRPDYTSFGEAPLNADGVCSPASGWGANLEGVVYVVPPQQPSTAFGVASPGKLCVDVSCSTDSLWPDNRRRAIFTANTLVKMAPYVTPVFSIAAHEFGHTLNWPHSYAGVTTGACSARRADDVCEYDNPVDVMSRVPSLGTEPTRLGEVQSTLAINRYAAGWLDPSLVAIHAGGKANYTLVAKGGAAVASDGRELLVLPSTDPAAFVTAEVRVRKASWDPKMATYDGTLDAEGVVVHVIDQRAEVGCPLSKPGVGLDRCSGLGRRQQPYGAVPNAYKHVLTAGQSLTIGATTLAVVSGADGRFKVTVNGGPISIDPVANASITLGADGIAARLDPPVPPLVPALASWRYGNVLTPERRDEQAISR